ncbi:MAG: hypothetical protein RL685_1939 [Pseudomonadota bacterium]
MSALHHRLLATIVAVGAYSSPALAHAQLWALEDRSYFDPHISSPRDAMIKVLFPAWSDAFEYAQTEGGRLVWDISLGKEIPLLGFETSPTKDDVLPRGRWGFGLWLPVGFHMIEDLTGDDSAPILDTDYRFSAMLKARYALWDELWLKARFSVGHESTHIGDEFALAAQRAPAPSNFLRVNVSHEDWDIAGGVDATFGDHEIDLLAGVSGLLRPSRGYYSTSTLETNGVIVPRSHDNLEPYFSAQYFYLAGVLGSWAPWASVDARHRSIYDYARASAATPEERQWSLNLLIGLRDQEQQYGQKGKIDLYGRVYYGVNPAGQFRNDGDYLLFGIGIHVPI